MCLFNLALSFFFNTNIYFLKHVENYITELHTLVLLKIQVHSFIIENTASQMGVCLVTRVAAHLGFFSFDF